MDQGWRASDSDIEAIAASRHGDPFAVLGPHLTSEGWALRVFMPDAARVEAVSFDGETFATLERRSGDFFEGRLQKHSDRPSYRLRVGRANGHETIEDPYRFGPVLGPLDDYLAAEGAHLQLHRRFGAQPKLHEGVEGVHFSVWAPNAERVSVIGDFNAWDGRRNPMRKRLGAGLWELFFPNIGIGATYKFEIRAANGDLVPQKADPLGRSAELRPATASVVASNDEFSWSDSDYLKRRSEIDPRRRPISIYEVHLGSWRRGEDNRFLSYDELAEQLIPYAKDLGFTHIEMLPVSEHPLDDSWGYQPVGLFAPTRRFGDPDGFARFVDRAHAADIGVILDWVPAHFPTDAHGLARFDGTALYEHADPRQGFHPDWNTAIYNFGRREVSNFLTDNALFWFERFHVDGLRVDAVASMLYLDYSRKAGEWIPNSEGGNENKEAIAFLRRVNEAVYSAHPGALMIAEESTAFPAVSKPVYAGGLGFGFKWNMGWMHDTLAYMSRDPVHRRWSHDEMTFGLLYAFSENFILPISHDEVVHGKGALVSKMPGDEWRRFANLRAYLGFMWAHPGKKLLFMGQEFGQTSEWNAKEALPWWLLGHKPHQGVQRLVRDLNTIYRSERALYGRDCEAQGFRWIAADDAAQSVFAFVRYGEVGDPPIAIVCNFTPVPREGYAVGLPIAGRWIEALNTDSAVYGGTNIGNAGAVEAKPDPMHGLPASAILTLPPLATILLKFQP